jgi:hypothetical protein
MTATDDKAIEFVGSYLAARHAWERDAWTTWRRARTAATLERTDADFTKRLGEFFDDPSRAPTSFGEPPSVDPATTEFAGVTRRRGRIVVTTRGLFPGTDMRITREYVLSAKDGRLRIADIRGGEPGDWTSLMR